VIVVRSRADLLISGDGGATWQRADGYPLMPSVGTPSQTGLPTAGPSAEPEEYPITRSGFRYPHVHQEMCVPSEPRHCYRVDPPALQVSETIDGGKTWNTVWKISSQEQQRLKESLKETCDSPFDILYSAALTVLTRPKGHVVVVANGCDGVAVRDTSGAWHRWTFRSDGVSPSPSPGANQPLWERTPSTTDEGDHSLRNSLIVGAVIVGLICLTAVAIGLRSAAPPSRGQ
jgi:hypothetical protein